MIVGLDDELADPADAQWAYEQIKSNVVFYKEYSLGHLSFFTAKDFSYFT